MSRTRSRDKSAAPTMTDVARIAEVSVFTVSSVVNGTAVVREELRSRVLKAIEKTGYKRNAIARSLKTGRTMTIGVACGDITNPFCTDVVSEVQHALAKAGYAVMLSSNDQRSLSPEVQITILRDRMVDGLVVIATDDVSRLGKPLIETDLPFVLIDQVIEGLDCDAVVLDNRAAAGEALRHLLDLGHRRIGLVSGMLESFTGRERLSAYQAILKEVGVESDPDLIRFGNYRIADALEATRSLLGIPDPPTAIFSSNNLMTIGVMKGIRQLGLRCPEDISVAGVDDFPWSDAFRPELTVVAQPIRSFGEQAVALLLDRLRGEHIEGSRRVVLQGELRVRGSCGPYVPPSKPKTTRSGSPATSRH